MESIPKCGQIILTKNKNKTWDRLDIHKLAPMWIAKRERLARLRWDTILPGVVWVHNFLLACSRNVSAA